MQVAYQRNARTALPTPKEQKRKRVLARDTSGQLDSATIREVVWQELMTNRSVTWLALRLLKSATRQDEHTRPWFAMHMGSC